jgi:AraC-like DNA-binding protein
MIFCLVFQSALAIYLLGTTKKKEAFDSQIRKLLLVLTIHLTTKFLLLYFIGDTFFFAKTATGFTFFYGPFLLTMANQLLQKKSPKKILYIHFIPFFVCLAIYFAIFLWGCLGYMTMSEMEIYNNTYQVLAVISLISYTAIVKIRLKAFKHQGNYLIALQKKLVNAIASVLLIGIISGLILNSLHLSGSVFEWLNVRTIIYTNLLLIPVLVIKYKFQSTRLEIISAASLPGLVNSEPIITIAETTTKKYQKSGIDETLLAVYEEKIIKHMKKNKPYLNAELSLDELSKQISIPKHHITQTLSAKIGKSFYQFVNEFRIQEAIVRLKKSPDESMLSLAYDVGFNSKSSFNFYFKKVTGYTPLVYKKENASSE